MNYETDYYREFEEIYNTVADLDGVKEMKPTRYHVVHLRKFNEYEISNTGGCTLYVHDCDTFFAVSKAICSKKDQFCRKIGRNLASKRMEEGQVDILYKSKLLNKLEHVITMYRSLIDEGV